MDHRHGPGKRGAEGVDRRVRATLSLPHRR
jgi:hypothetical protein